MFKKIERVKACCACGQVKPFEDFPPHYRNYNRYGADESTSYRKECYDCMFDRAEERNKKETSIRNPVEALLYSETSKAKKHGLVVLKDWCEHCRINHAVQIHHPKKRRPLITESLCKECHDKQHTKINITRKRRSRAEREAMRIPHTRGSAGKSWGDRDELHAKHPPKPSYTPVVEDKRRKEFRDAARKISVPSNPQ